MARQEILKILSDYKDRKAMENILAKPHISNYLTDVKAYDSIFKDMILLDMVSLLAGNMQYNGKEYMLEIKLVRVK